MPLFLITGLPGVGKSTVCAELKSRGYVAYDGDEDHLAKWYNSTTGQVVTKEERVRTPEFLATHSRDIAPDVIEKLVAKAHNKPIFLCGDPENEADVRHLFVEIFELVVDEQTLKYRLATRTNNDWGKLPHEVAYSLASRQKLQDNYRASHYVLIDATQPTKDIVDAIFAQIGDA